MKKVYKLLFAFICVLLFSVVFIPKIKVNATETKFQAQNEETFDIYTFTEEENSIYFKVYQYRIEYSYDLSNWKEIDGEIDLHLLIVRMDDGFEYSFYINEEDKTLQFGNYKEIDLPVNTTDTENTNTGNDTELDYEELTKEDIEAIIKEALEYSGFTDGELNKLQELYNTITNQDLTFKEKVIYVVVVVLCSLGVSTSVLAMFYYGLKNRNKVGIKQVDDVLDAMKNTLQEVIQVKQEYEKNNNELKETADSLNKLLDYQVERDKKLVEALGDE